MPIQDVKVDFVIDPVSFKAERNRCYFDENHSLSIDTIENIITNKFCTLTSRIEPKDFIDFYFLNIKSGMNPLSAIYEGARTKDAIFDDPPTVACQIEQGIQFLRNNSDILPSTLIEFDLNDFFKFYHQTIDWICQKIEKSPEDKSLG